MNHDIHPMNQEEARAYLNWQYPAPYTFYNIPAADQAEELQAIFADNQDDYFAVSDGERMIGMYEYSFSDGMMEFGLGLRPELTGHGRGLQFAQAGLDFGRKHYAYRGPITLLVADFNQRARHLYQQLGFFEVGQEQANAYGTPVTFVRMQLG